MGGCKSKNGVQVDQPMHAQQAQNTQQRHLDQLVGKELPKQLVQQHQQNKDHNQSDDAEDEDEIMHRDKSKQRGDKKKGQNKIKAGNVSVDDEMQENIKIIQKKKIREDTQFIISCLKTHFVFYNLANNQLENIVSKMFYCEVDANQFIFKQGDNASSYFILAEGQCEVIINDKLIRKIKQGEHFGELALLYNAPRSASIKTIEKCALWGIDRKTFRKNVEEMVAKEFLENRAFLEKIQFFQFMTNDQKDAIAGVLISQKFQQNQIIVHEGDQANSFYIIKSGQVSILKEMPDKTQKFIRKMQQEDSFGEQALYYNSTRGCTVRADTEEVKCLALGREEAQNILGDQIQTIVYRNIQKWAFDKSQILIQLTQIQKERIVMEMQMTNVDRDAVVFQKGEICNKIVIVIEGQLISQSDNQTVAVKGLAFGDQYVLEKNMSIPIKDNIIMQQSGVLGQISFKQFFKIIGGKFEDVVIKNQNSHEKQMKKQIAKKDLSHWKIEDLIHIKKLGYGQFGNVYLTKSKLTGELYALKCISKAQVIEQSLEKHLVQEKTVMELVEFPFIMNFQRSFKDNYTIYFLIEYIRGMELFDVIREIGLLNTYDSQFYIGSLILCLEFLHARNIIYRDLKPENIMIDEKGYVKMIDMGTAKILSSKQGMARTYTIIGTPHYMAPEIITGKGYSFMVDLWSLGIVLYEFMCGGVPFAEEAEDPYEIYEEIIKKPLQFPGFLKDKKAKKIMNQLLHKVPELRIGGSYAALKANPWFNTNTFDWDKLYSKELPVPYKPPEEKMIRNSEIIKQEQVNKPINDELKATQDKKYRKEQAKDPNWDSVF